MKVSAQYAVEHFAELLSAQDRGEEVEIARDSKPTLMLVTKPEAAPAIVKRPRSELFGSWAGKGWISENFNSPELNKEIEDEFLNGPIFPVEQ